MGQTAPFPVPPPHLPLGQEQHGIWVQWYDDGVGREEMVHGEEEKRLGMATQHALPRQAFLELGRRLLSLLSASHCLALHA